MYIIFIFFFQLDFDLGVMNLTSIKTLL